MNTPDDLLYIWQQPDWQHWRLDAAVLVEPLAPPELQVEGMMERVQDATGRFEQPMTSERLSGWLAGRLVRGPVSHGIQRYDADLHRRVAH